MSGGKKKKEKKKRSEVEGERKARQTEREGGGDEVGDRGSLCMNIKVFLLLPLPDM